MPLVTAANVPYNPVPTEKPAETPGEDYQRIQGISPDAFGFGVGQAQSKLGQTFEQASDMLAKHALELQTQKNQSDANERFLQGMIETGEKEAAFKALTGKDAAAAYPKYQQDILALRDKYKDGLNPAAARMFDQQYTRRAGFLISDGAGHAALEQRRAFVAGNKAIQYNAVGDIAQHPDDEARFSTNLATIKQHAVDEMVAQGYPAGDPVTVQKVNQAVSEAYERRIFEITKTDPAGASKIWKDHQGEIVDPIIREKIQGHLTQGWLQNGTRDDAERILNGGDPQRNAYGGQLSSDIGTAASLVKRHESEGLAKQLGISPYVIGVGGTDLSKTSLDENGFPKWGGAGDSHAAGAYQFQPGTWAKYAKPLGIHNFSPESQDKVFEAAYKAEGYGPWKPYNTSLAAELDRGGAKVIPVAATGGGLGLISSAQAAEPVTSLGEGPAKNLDEALQRADAVIDQRVKDGLLGGASGVPEAQVRENLKARIRTQYNMSQAAGREMARTKLYAARSAVLAVGEDGSPVYKSIDQFLADDANRQVYYDLDDPGKAVVRNQIANNAKVVPMTMERQDAWQKLMDLHVAQPDEFVKVDPLSQDFPVSYKMRLANMIRETEKKAQDPESWRRDLGRALTQIKQEGLIINTGIDPTSKTDERSHRFVGALSRQLQEFEQEKKRPMNPDEIRKSVAGLMRTAVPWSWSSPLTSSKQGFEVFVPKSFRDEFSSKFRARWGAAPNTQQLVDAYHASDEYKKQAPVEAPEEEPNP